MPISITLATHINTLLDFLLERERFRLETPRPSSAEAAHAAQVLAEHSNKALMAGWNADSVRDAWAKQKPVVFPDSEWEDRDEAKAAREAARRARGAKK